MPDSASAIVCLPYLSQPAENRVHDIRCPGRQNVLLDVAAHPVVSLVDQPSAEGVGKAHRLSVHPVDEIRLFNHTVELRRAVNPLQEPVASSENVTESFAALIVAHRCDVT